MSRIRHKPFVALFFLVLLPLYLTWTFDHSLWNPDETRDAGIAREMWDTKDFVAPKLNGEPFLEKPPLYYWSCAVVYAVTGHVTDGLTRLPAALYGLLGVFFIFLIGRRLFDDETGLLAAAILAVSFQYFRMSHFALMDSALAALIAGAVYFYVCEKRWLFLLFTILAFFAKGFVAVALVGVIILVETISRKNYKRLALDILAGGVLFAVLVAPWIYGLWKEGGESFLRIFFIDNTWNRFFSDGADHQHPIYFYLGSFPVDFLPWTPFFVWALWNLRRRKENGFRFAKIWFLSLFVFLSLSGSKRSIYLMPVFPAAALLTAAWFRTKSVAWIKTAWGLFKVMTILLIIGSFFFVKKLDADKSFLPFIETVKSHRGSDEVIGFDMSEMERGVFYFYFEGRVRNFVHLAELAGYVGGNPDRKLWVIANRNKKETLGAWADEHLKVVEEFRADKKTRSYLLYSTP
jgi:4-amino-4-deoxy-L-arabinose transferase-like glycosyltransferase